MTEDDFNKILQMTDSECADIALVRFGGYHCEDCDELERCPAHEWCDTFSEVKDG